jgi:hypothetical protein
MQWQDQQQLKLIAWHVPPLSAQSEARAHTCRMTANRSSSDRERFATMRRSELLCQAPSERICPAWSREGERGGRSS